MENDRNFKGLKKYESLLKTVCMIEDYDDWGNLIETEGCIYNNLEDCEWEGCLGVACVISFIEGINPKMISLSRHLDIPHYDIHLQNAFERLKISGIFSNKQNIKNDPLLNGRGVDTAWRTASESEMSAWCYIAGLAAGKTGLGKMLKSESEKPTL